ncbi:MAG: hypothetical protein KA051_01540 [Paludibacteraceae bacterium]|jgi:hypothetical protein|nr:hypothetical protein [Paludibacteraceae bacterium]
MDTKLTIKIDVTLKEVIAQKAKEASQSISDYISSLITTAVNEKQENTGTADDLKKWKGIIHLNKDWKEEKEDYLMNETPDDAESIS